MKLGTVKILKCLDMTMTKVLIVGSGPSARQYDLYQYKENGWSVVVVNNAHVAVDDWDLWIKSTDYEGLHPDPKNIKPYQKLLASYVPSLNKYGGQHACGFSTMLNASYAVLDHMKPSVIGYLGADMNYTPNDKGETHVYGVGFDIKKHGMPDPERMIQHWSRGDPNFLEKIYQRFDGIASGEGCKVYNFSRDIETKLPYQRVKVEDID